MVGVGGLGRRGLAGSAETFSLLLPSSSTSSLLFFVRTLDGEIPDFHKVSFCLKIILSEKDGEVCAAARQRSRKIIRKIQ